MQFSSVLVVQIQIQGRDWNVNWGGVLDREPRGASLAEKVTNFYACNSDLHTLSSAEHTVVDIGRGGDEKIKLLLNGIAVIKKSIFYTMTRKMKCIFRKER